MSTASNERPLLSQFRSKKKGGKRFQERQINDFNHRFCDGRAICEQGEDLNSCCSGALVGKATVPDNPLEESMDEGGFGCGMSAIVTFSTC